MGNKSAVDQNCKEKRKESKSQMLCKKKEHILKLYLNFIFYICKNNYEDNYKFE